MTAQATAGTVVFGTPVGSTGGQLVPFTDELALPIPPNDTVVFDLKVAQYQPNPPNNINGGGACAVNQAQFTIREWLASP